MLPKSRGTVAHRTRMNFVNFFRHSLPTIRASSLAAKARGSLAKPVLLRQYG